MNAMDCTAIDYAMATQFLYLEARLLDDFRFNDWLHMLTPDIRYRLVLPGFAMAEEKEEAKTPPAYLMDETMSSLLTRVKQLMNPAYTIAENPRSQTRRHISNILTEQTDSGDTVRVFSNALVYRSRGSQAEPHIFSMGRTDLLRLVDGQLHLARRDAVLDQTVVQSRNMSGLF